MKKSVSKSVLGLSVVALASLAAFVALPAFAGDCVSGFSCDNECPLAQKANEHRALGSEGVASAPTLRTALVAHVTRNLSRV